jgi:hypothetical protein
MSWLYSQALVEEYLGDISLDGEQSVPLSGNLTQQAYLSQDKMTKFSRLSRFGMTYKPLTADLGEELLKSYLEAFPVRTLVPLEEEMGLMEKDQECGERWHGLLAKYNPNTHSWKTVQCSLFEDLELSLETWPRWGLMRDGVCWEQTPLVLPTNETVFGFSLPTPVASDATSGAVIGKNDTFYTTSTGMPRKVNQNGIDGSVGLGRLIQMWPTPIASRGGAWRGDGQVSMIARNVETYEEYWLLTQGTSKKKREKYWPTPQASDNRDRGNMSNPSVQRRVDIGKQVMLSQSVDPNSGQLNPTWVEWLMGWPIGWTDLKPLEMDKSHCVQQQLGEF